MRSVLSVLALGASLASAIEFTDPAENATVTKGAAYDLQWTSVDTDPTSFSVYLVNFVNWPPYYTALDLNIETSTGEASVQVPCDIDNSYGYQFNAINGTNVYVIYAQTPKFFVTGDSCTDPVTTAALPATTCAAAATVTETVTVRAGGNLKNAGNATAPAASAPSAPSSAPASTYAGECPETIGWSGNYSHPVTLTSTPHAGRAVATQTADALPAGTGYPVVSGGAYNWNATVATTLVAPSSAPVATPTGLPTKVQSSGAGSCSKKGKSRKRHSDGGRRSPFPKKL